MIQISLEQWNSIPDDYKSVWTEDISRCNSGFPKEWVGKKCVFEGCVTKHGGVSLITEGVHFEIVD